jgi:hypothetical protein
LDLQQRLPAVCRADQCVIGVRDMLYIGMAFPDVAFVQEEYLHQSLGIRFSGSFFLAKKVLHLTLYVTSLQSF